MRVVSGATMSGVLMADGRKLAGVVGRCDVYVHAAPEIAFRVQRCVLAVRRCACGAAQTLIGKSEIGMTSVVSTRTKVARRSK